MKKDMKERLREELDGMRTRLDELRVKGKLGTMELRDKLAEYKQAFDPAYAKAKQKLGDLAESGVDESKALAESLRAGWDEVRRTHQELADKAHRRREEEHDAKRNRD